MDELFERYVDMKIDGTPISLEPGEITVPYYCYPVGAKPIGFEGCILYCFLPEYGPMVFASNPENYGDRTVYPLAQNFRDFLRLILACGSANPVEQIVWMDKERFWQHLREEYDRRTEEQKALLGQISERFELTAMENPFEYVKELQAEFDDSRIVYSDEYYDTLGIEQPEME